MVVREPFLGTFGSAFAGLDAFSIDPVDALAATVRSAVAGLFPFVANSIYKLKCWEASDDTPTTFQFFIGPGQLFFNKELFKWKDRVPGQK